MTTQLSFEEGISEAIRRLNEAHRRPILACVYGTPGSGKSTFMKRIREYFVPRGLEVADHGGAPDATNFERYRDFSSHYQNMMILFHCGWHKSKFSSEDEDPNILSERILGRTLDLNIGIFNSKIFEHLDGEYDLVLRR